MTGLHGRAGWVVFCLGLVAAGVLPLGLALAQSDDSDAPAQRRAQPEAPGSDVFDGTDKRIGAPKGPPASAPPAGQRATEESDDAAPSADDAARDEPVPADEPAPEGD